MPSLLEPVRDHGAPRRVAQTALVAALVASLLLTSAVATSGAATAASPPAAALPPNVPFEVRYGAQFDEYAWGRPYLEVELEPSFGPVRGVDLAPATVRVADASGAYLDVFEIDGAGFEWRAHAPLSEPYAVEVEVASEAGSWTLVLQYPNVPEGFGPVGSVTLEDRDGLGAPRLTWEAVPGAAVYRVGLSPVGEGRPTSFTTPAPELLLAGIEVGAYRVNISAFSADPATPAKLLATHVSHSDLGVIELQAGAQAADELGALTGVVLVGSRPAPGSTVMVRPHPSAAAPSRSGSASSRTALTDDEGRYRFEGLAPGLYWLTLPRAPVTPYEGPRIGRAVTPTVGAGEVSQAPTMYLVGGMVPQGRLAGGVAAPGEVALEWEPVVDAAGYHVTVGRRLPGSAAWTDGDLMITAATHEPSWQVLLEPQSVYEIVVEGLDHEGVRIADMLLSLRTTPGEQ